MFVKLSEREQIHKIIQIQIPFLDTCFNDGFGISQEDLSTQTYVFKMIFFYLQICPAFLNTSFIDKEAISQEDLSIQVKGPKFK
jgi:hypothetical protein